MSARKELPLSLSVSTVSLALALAASGVTAAPAGDGGSVGSREPRGATSLASVLRTPTEPSLAHLPESDTLGTDSIADAIVASIDRAVRRRVREERVPGAAFVLVVDGRVVSARGYGVADLSTGRPVSATGTRFSFGSISKLVTAVAALQLRDRGRLALDAPVTRYLPAGLLEPDAADPITLHDLLTHTAGLEPRSAGVAARRPSELRGLENYLSAPGTIRRARPPGQFYLYSQQGYGLVGLAVARAAGRPFEEYVADEIFRPLGMRSASVRATALDGPRTVSGYRRDGKTFRRTPRAYLRIPPAGSLVATPREMGSLIAAVLGNGERDRDRLFSRHTPEELLARQWSPHPHPAVEGTSYGLFEYRACGLRGLSANGWVGGQSSYLHLLPGRKTGLLVAANASSLGGLEGEVRRILHHSLSPGRCRPEVAPDGAAPAPGLEGHYRSIGFASDGIERLARTFLANEIVVSLDRVGRSAAEIDLGETRVGAGRAGPGLLVAHWGEGEEELFAFPGGTSLAHPLMMWGSEPYGRVSVAGRRSTVRTLTGLAMVLFLSWLLLPARRFLRRRRDRRARVDSPAEGSDDRSGYDPPALLHGGATALSLLWILFAVGVAAHLGGDGRFLLAFGVPGTLKAVLWLPAAGLLLGSALVAAALREAPDETRRWPMVERLHWAAVVGVAWSAGLWFVTTVGPVPY